MTTISGEIVVGTYDVVCPACRAEIPIPVKCWQSEAEQTHEGYATLTCEPDLADLWSHMWTHEGDDHVG